MSDRTWLQPLSRDALERRANATTTADYEALTQTALHYLARVEELERAGLVAANDLRNMTLRAEAAESHVKELERERDRLATEIASMRNSHIPKERVRELREALGEAKALLAEAYSGERPSNRWRMRVETLGAWPLAAVPPAPAAEEKP